MTDKKRSALGYRVKKVDVKSLVISAVTLGFKRPQNLKEEAKTYKYIFEEKGICIYEIDLSGDTNKVAFKPIVSTAERDKILSKGKFEEGPCIYYLDRETIS